MNSLLTQRITTIFKVVSYLYLLLRPYSRHPFNCSQINVKRKVLNPHRLQFKSVCFKSTHSRYRMFQKLSHSSRHQNGRTQTLRVMIRPTTAVLRIVERIHFLPNNLLSKVPSLKAHLQLHLSLKKATLISNKSIHNQIKVHTWLQVNFPFSRSLALSFSLCLPKICCLFFNRRFSDSGTSRSTKSESEKARTTTSSCYCRDSLWKQTTL